MTLRFIIGRAGAGKTHHCLEGVRAELRRSPSGPALFLLVPEQASYQTGRELLEGLPGFSRAQVISFERLADMVGTAGGALPALGESARLLVLRRILAAEKPNLRTYAGAVERPGFVAALAAGLTELARCRLEPERLDELALRLGRAGGRAAATADKLADLARIDRAYSEFLSGRFLRPERALVRAVPAIRNWPMLRGARIWIDGFAGFTPSEYAVLEALSAAADRVQVALCLDPNHPTVADPHVEPDTTALFSREAQTLRRLSLAAERLKVACEPPLLLRGAPPRWRSAAALAHLESGLLADKTALWPTEPDGIALTVADDMRAEVREAAREIRRLMRDEGFRAGDVAVVLRDVSVYADRIDEIFPEHGIPYFIDRRRPAGRHPAVRIVRAALRVVADDGWDLDDVLAFLSTDLVDAPRAALDRLVVEARRRRIRRADWLTELPWTPVDAADGFDVDAVRKSATAALRAFHKRVSERREPPMRAMCGAVWLLLEDLKVAERPERESDGGADEHGAILRGIGEMLDEIVQAAGDACMTVRAFAESLEPALEALTIAQVPQSPDGVIVGQIERSRLPRVRAALVLGLSETVFPQTGREDPVLSDADRRWLTDDDALAGATAERRLFDETTLGYLAFTRASGRLWLSRPARGDSGAALNPSRLLDRLLRLFPALPVRRVGGSVESCRAVESVDDLAALLAIRAGAAPGATADEPRTELEDALRVRNHLLRRPAPPERLRRPIASRPSEQPSRLPREVAAALFPDGYTVSVRRLEEFAACPFQSFVRGVLDPANLPEPDLAESALDTVRRNAMLGLERAAVGDPSPETWDNPRFEKEFARAVGAAEERFDRDALTARDLFRLRRSRRMLERTAGIAVSALRVGGLRPRAIGMPFGGPEDDLPGLTWILADGRRVAVTGRIDRIDAAPDGDRAAVVVREYRRSPWSVGLDKLHHVLSLGPALNLLVVLENGRKLLGADPTAAAALLIPLMPGPPGEADSGKPTDEPFGRRHGIVNQRLAGLLAGEFARAPSKPRQISDSAVTALLAHVRDGAGAALEELCTGSIAVRPFRLGKNTACGRCELRSVCRFDPDVDRFRELPTRSASEIIRELDPDGD